MSHESARPGIRLTFCAISDVGRVRDNNEDAFVALDLDGGGSFAETNRLAGIELGPRGVVIAVSDGMGGAQAGEVASALVLQTLEESLASSQDSIDEAFQAAVEKANLAVYQAAQDVSRRGMGATLTAVLLHGKDAYIAAVGDSRAYLQRGTRFRRMTRDQSYVQVLLDAGVLDSQEAARSPFKNVVLQSMGQKPDVQVALGRLALFRGDRLLLCSDGLTGHVTDEEIANEFARPGVGIDAIVRTLVDLALARGGEDNITVVVAEVTGEGLGRAEMPENVTQTYQVIQEFEAGIGGPRAGRQGPTSSFPPPPAAAREVTEAPTQDASVRSSAAELARSPGIGKLAWMAAVVALVVVVALGAFFALAS